MTATRIATSVVNTVLSSVAKVVTIAKPFSRRREKRKVRNENNDLISREYVKAKMFDIPKPKEGSTFWDGVDTVGDIIDNAPTVAVDEEIERQREELYHESKKLFDTARMLGVERPQGEWLHNGINVEGMDLYRCSICNRTIVTWSSRLNEYPYCHCGAKMQKGGVANDT